MLQVASKIIHDAINKYATFYFKISQIWSGFK